MKFSLYDKSESQEIINLFKTVFTASEGVESGKFIAQFVTKLISTTKQEDLISCVAKENNVIRGCVFFSRFIVPNEEEAFILSPAAVSTEIQGTGIGQNLIRFGLNHLKALSTNLVFTYGDPNFYSKVGFKQIGEDIIKAPYPLSQPIGWLAQSLNDEEIKAMPGVTQCVDALNDPSLW